MGSGSKWESGENLCNHCSRTVGGLCAGARETRQQALAKTFSQIKLVRRDVGEVGCLGLLTLSYSFVNFLCQRFNPIPTFNER